MRHFEVFLKGKIYEIKKQLSVISKNISIFSQILSKIIDLENGYKLLWVCFLMSDHHLSIVFKSQFQMDIINIMFMCNQIDYD